MKILFLSPAAALTKMNASLACTTVALACTAPVAADAGPVDTSSAAPAAAAAACNPLRVDIAMLLLSLERSCRPLVEAAAHGFSVRARR